VCLQLICIAMIDSILGFFLPAAHAAIWTATSTTDILDDVYSDTGLILVLVIGTVVVAVVALMGLGYGIRHLKKWILGKKF